MRGLLSEGVLLGLLVLLDLQAWVWFIVPWTELTLLLIQLELRDFHRFFVKLLCQSYRILVNDIIEWGTFIFCKTVLCA